MIKNWREGISEELKEQSETWADIICNTFTEEQMDVRMKDWDDRYRPFTLWTEKRVYFPATYDGSHWVESVPRNPCDEATDAVGG